VNPGVRLVLVTGGPGAGKTALTRRLYGGLPKNWRFVPLDNFIGLALANPKLGDWPDATIAIAGVCLDYWRKEKVYNLLVEGVIQSTDHVESLAKAFSLTWPSNAVRVIRLDRSFEAMKKRRAAESEWSPPMAPGMTREQAFLNLEMRVPRPIPGERRIDTDHLTEGEVYEAALRFLE
jgi:hypothetical protein